MVVLKLYHNDVELDSVEVGLDDANRIIGIAAMGGYQRSNVKYICSEYFFTDNFPNEIRLNLITEAELAKKHLEDLKNRMAGLEPSFVSKLVPPFQRKNRSDLN